MLHRSVSGRRLGAALLAATVVVLVALVAGTGVARAGTTPAEKKLLKHLDDAYAWDVTEHQLTGGEVVAGTASGLANARWIAAEMKRLGLRPGGTKGYLEAFPVWGWEDQGSSVTLQIGAGSPTVIPSKQGYKGAGTGPAGITADVVYVNNGTAADYEGLDVAGKIVLFHRQLGTAEAPLFYGLPQLMEARARGAVGALMDYPIIEHDALKTDVTGVSIPCAYITNDDSQAIQTALLAHEAVSVKLVVDNKVATHPDAQNVIGVIPGTKYPGQFVYLVAHFDHWFTSACDNDAGVGSLLAVAKAFKQAHVRPDRTIVFMADDSEELGGPPDTWYDWLLGSFSHIVGTLRDDGTLGPAIHGERAGKIVAMLNMDVVGGKDTEAYIETTPELTAFFDKAAHDSGVYRATGAGSTYVYWPPASYDDWSFFMAGVPCMQIAWWGAAYDPLYHVTTDTMDKIDPVRLHANMAFNALGVIRLTEAKVLPYALSENVAVSKLGLGNLKDKVPDAMSTPDIRTQPLLDGMAAYDRAAKRAAGKMAARGLTERRIARIDLTLMAQAKALNPHLFDWDTNIIPGWTGLFLFDTYAKDLAAVNAAIAALEADTPDRAAAATALQDVTTMVWGKLVGREAYQAVLEETVYTPHPLWGAGFIPRHTDVQLEYQSLATVPPGARMSDEEVLQHLKAKRLNLYDAISNASIEAGTAYTRAARILDRL